MADQKQWWAPVWKGLVMGKPVHRKRMGIALWLFLYLLINADRRTGALFRKIRTIASDMETTRDTVMRWLVILRSEGYIATTSTGRHLSIQINKWRPSGVADIVQEKRRKCYPRGWDYPAEDGSPEAENGANVRAENAASSFPNDKYINKSLINDIVSTSQFKSFKDFVPQDKEELLAVDLADALSDRDNLPLYLFCARRYPEQFLRSILGEVKEIPINKIKKSRGALFNHLVQKYANKTHENTRN